MSTLLITGVPSVATAASPSHAADAPELVSIRLKLLGVVRSVDSSRHGFADPPLTSRTAGSRSKGKAQPTDPVASDADRISWLTRAAASRSSRDQNWEPCTGSPITVRYALA